MKIVIVTVCLVLLATFSFADIDKREESLLHGLSDAIVKGCKTDQTKVYALMEFVHQKIKPKPGENPNSHYSTLERIQKGVGWCNHQSTVFMHLAYYQEIKTRLVYLINTEKTASPHTIAEWWNGKEWVIADSMFMVHGITRDEIRQENFIDDRPFSWLRGKFPLIKDKEDKWLECFLNEPQIVFEYNPLPN